MTVAQPPDAVVQIAGDFADPEASRTGALATHRTYLLVQLFAPILHQEIFIRSQAQVSLQVAATRGVKAEREGFVFRFAANHMVTSVCDRKS